MEKLSFPDRITIELTNNCNVSCTFCSRQQIDMEIGYISDELFYKIIDEAAEHLPIKLVPFFRGEPLMHPHIIEYLKYAKSKGLGPIQLATNALILNEKMQDALIDVGVDFISCSLDTTDEEVYKCSRLTGSLEISSRNLESMAKKCKERRMKGLTAPMLQVSSIDIDVYRPNHEEFMEKWKEYVDVIRIYEEHDEKGKFVNPEVQKKLDVFNDRRPCKKVFTDMLIYWDGRLALCCYDWDQDWKIGNINNMTLQEAWDSPVYEKIRNMHFTGKYADGLICKDCHHWKSDYTEAGFLGKTYNTCEM